MAEDTRWVEISYSPKAREVGQRVQLPLEEAKEKVREGRARYLTDEERAEEEAKLKPAEGESGPKSDAELDAELAGKPAKAAKAPARNAGK